MKFMVMHKSSADTEAEKIPSQELIANVGKLLKDAMDAGTFVDGAGLLSSKRRARVKVLSGERSVQKGPYKGEHELVSRFAMLKVADLPEAIEWGTRLSKAAGDVEVELGPVTEPWDLGMAEKPADAPLRVLALIKANQHETISAQQTAELDQVIADAGKAGVFIASHNLLPSAQGARVSGAKGARTVVDGPFSESKELIAGYMILQFADKAEAIAFAKKYADVVGTPEVDVRAVG